MFVWKCEECGSVHKQLQAPEICPGCGTPKEHFTKKVDEEVKIFWESRIDRAEKVMNG